MRILERTLSSRCGAGRSAKHATVRTLELDMQGQNVCSMQRISRETYQKVIAHCLAVEAGTMSDAPSCGASDSSRSHGRRRPSSRPKHCTPNSLASPSYLLAPRLDGYTSFLEIAVTEGAHLPLVDHEFSTLQRSIWLNPARQAQVHVLPDQPLFKYHLDPVHSTTRSPTTRSAGTGTETQRSWCTIRRANRIIMERGAISNEKLSPNPLSIQVRHSSTNKRKLGPPAGRSPRR